MATQIKAGTDVETESGFNPRDVSGGWRSERGALKGSTANFWPSRELVAYM